MLCYIKREFNLYKLNIVLLTNGMAKIIILFFEIIFKSIISIISII